MPTKIELQSAPSTLALYWRILTARKSGAVDEADTLLAEATLAGVRSDPVKLAGYRKVCGFTNGSHLPATFPFVQAMPLQLSLLVSDAFPFSPLGIVHVSNRITQYRPVAVDELLDFRCTLSGPRRTDRGLEFDLLTQVTIDGELVWECLCTMLRRDRATRKRRRPGSSGDSAGTFSAETATPIAIAADTGRRYASVSGDRNPIHLYGFSAKLFGFPRAIAHGMWTKARCLAELEQTLQQAPFNGKFQVDVSFKRPLFMPASARFERSGSDFRVTTGNGRRVHMIGQLSAL